MFNKRALQVKMVRADDTQMSTHPNSGSFEKSTTIAVEALDKTVKTVSLAVCGYVILDTIRQVVVNKTTR